MNMEGSKLEQVLSRKSCSNCVNCDEYDERCIVHNMPIPRPERERVMIAENCEEYAPNTEP